MSAITFIFNKNIHYINEIQITKREVFLKFLTTTIFKYAKKRNEKTLWMYLSR